MAGLPYIFNSHSLRHKFGHDLARKGANNTVISSLLGHANLQSSYRYTELFGSEIDEQYAKFLG
jgi:site-specific recombinase XerD